MGTAVSLNDVDVDRVRAQYERELRALRLMTRPGTDWSLRPHIGLELEICIVHSLYGTVMHGVNVELKSLDEHLTVELGDWQLELNLTPVKAAGRPFSAMLAEIVYLLGLIADAVRPLGGEPVLVGIVPTLTPNDTAPEHITVEPDNARYTVLDRALAEHYPFRHVRIEGPSSSLDMRIRSVVDEAACTSMQTHITTTPRRYPTDLDALRIAMGPAKAIGTNSPILYGNCLLHDNRPAVFAAATQRTPVEDFWFRSLADSYRWATAQPVLVAVDTPEFYQDPMAVLAAGGWPLLQAIGFGNGSNWAWQRPVWDPNPDYPHFRIEDRPDPAQPTPIDVVAQAAYKIGLAQGIAKQILTGNVDYRNIMNITTPRENFEIAQRDGPNSRLWWPRRGKLTHINALELTGEILLPLAGRGLRALGVDFDEIRWTLDVIEGRARNGQTGSSYQLDAFNRLLRHTGGNRTEAAQLMFTRYREHAATGAPVHTWKD